MRNGLMSIRYLSNNSVLFQCCSGCLFVYGYGALKHDLSTLFVILFRFLKCRIDSPFVGPSKMMFGLTKGGKLRKVTTHNALLANQTMALFVVRWLS